MTLTDEPTIQTPEQRLAEIRRQPNVMNAGLVVNEATVDRAADSVIYVLPDGSKGTLNGGPEVVTFTLGGLWIQNDRTTDPLVMLGWLRRLLDTAEEAVLDARQAQVDAEQDRCVCDKPLDPSEVYCGDRECAREIQSELDMDRVGF